MTRRSLLLAVLLVAAIAWSILWRRPDETGVFVQALAVGIPMALIVGLTRKPD